MILKSTRGPFGVAITKKGCSVWMVPSDRKGGLKILIVGLLLVQVCAAQTYIPDPQRTPGAINPNVTQVNVFETVCVPGWTKRIRPTSSYIDRLESEQMGMLELSGSTNDYHMDHLVPLCAGGHPSDPRNLWLQPLDGHREQNGDESWRSYAERLCARGIPGTPENARPEAPGAEKRKSDSSRAGAGMEHLGYAIVA